MAKSISKILIVLFISSTLSGCCYFCKKDPIIHEVELPIYSCPAPPELTRPNMLHVTFNEPLFEKVIVGLDETNYKNIYVNDSNLLFYIGELERVIKIYKDEQVNVGKSLKEIKEGKK